MAGLAMAVAQHGSLAVALRLPPPSSVSATFKSTSSRLHCAASSSSQSSSSSEEGRFQDRSNSGKIEQADASEMEKRSMLVKRSDLVAKQVVSVSNAFCLGYVTQLWIHAEEWCVKALELKPSLLFGEVEGVFLSSLLKVGDVVLLEDENCLQGDLHLPSYDSIIGWDLVTERGRHLGKVRDYVFDLRQGKLSYLEFDSLGISFLPASMISTYRLMIEDVILLTSDAIVVKAGSEDRVRRLTKGLVQLRQQTAENKPRRRRRVGGKFAASPGLRLSRTEYSYQDEKLDEMLESHLRQSSGDTLLRYKPTSEKLEYD